MDNIASLCFSSLPILRCASFSRLENQILIIPTALEVIFSTTLLFTNWRSGRRFLLITAEGWTYLSLAILELLSHVLSEVRTNITVYRTIDITIAAASLLPIFFYTLFLYLFMKSDLIDILPRRFQAVCKYLLVIFIPAIVALHEVASFLGVSYRVIPVSSTKSSIFIGFNTQREGDSWTFLTSIVLALHTAFQAINFSLAFFRIAKAFFVQRQIEVMESDEVYIFNGIGWMAGGLKLGAIETVVGFAPQSGFGGALTRRILRFLSRACLCIGIVKGREVHENFGQMRDEMSHKPGTKLLISGPRTSTFLQMSPSATAFHSAPRAPAAGRSKLNEVQNGLPGMANFSGMKDDDNTQRRERVTVHYQGGAPMLHMRFSAFDVPNPAAMTESIPALSAIEEEPLKHQQTRRTKSVHYPSSDQSSMVDLLRTPIAARHTRAFSVHSGADSLSSLAAVRELADQFPGLPPRVTPKTRTQTSYPDSVESRHPTSLKREDSSATQTSLSSYSVLSRSMSRNSSVRRKPVPRISDNIDPFAEDDDEQDVPPPLPTETDQVPVNNSRHVTNNSVSDSFGSTPRTNLSVSVTGLSGTETDATTPASEDPFMYDGPGKTEVGVASPQSAIRAVHDYVVDIPDTVPEEPESDTITAIRKAIPAARIKSVGVAPRRSTPRPTKTSAHQTRGSIYIEPILIPPKPQGMPVAVQEDFPQSVTSNYSSALRDSNVFGSQDGQHFQYAY